MRRAFYIAGVNLCVFVGLFIATLLVVSVIGDALMLASLAMGERDKSDRNELPVYIDSDLSREVFAEQRKVASVYAAIVGWRKEPFVGQFVNIDKDGLRRHTLGLDNRPDAKSIGFFGGSTMWGTGVADNATIPALFDGLNDAYEVTNYGQRGWRNRQSLAELVNLYNQGRLPDIVVFYDGANDPAIGCDLAFGAGYNETHESPYLRRLIHDSEVRSFLYRNFVAPAWDTFRRVTGRDKIRGDRTCHTDTERARQVALTLFKNWELAKMITERNGSKFYAFLQPVAGVGKPRLDYLSLNQNILQQYPPVYRFVRELIAQRGAGWAFDISDAFDGSKRYYIDHLHVTAQGNEIIAKRMLRTIEAANK